MFKTTKMMILALLVLGSGVYANEQQTFLSQILGKGLQGTLARSIKIGEKITFNLTADNCRIVIPQNSTPVACYAASELQTFLSQILGKKIAIAETPGSGTNIYVGFSDDVLKKGFDPEKLARDGFYIRTIGRDIILAGRDDPRVDMLKRMKIGGFWGYHFERATYFAVLDFLERFCGVRFYFPGELGTIVPSKQSIEIPEIDIVERPDMIKRWYLAWYDGEYFEENNLQSYPNFSKELNLMRQRFGTMIINQCHGLRGFNILGRFGKTNPGYFRLTDTDVRETDPNILFPGHLCFNSKVTDVIYQDMKAYLLGQPPPEGYFWFGGKDWASIAFRKPIVDIGLQDAYSPCYCKECQAAYQKDRPDYATELVWNTFIDWGERLKKDNVPGYLTAPAYYPYTAIPKRDVPDNILVQVATTGPWVNNPKLLKAHNDLIAGWSKKLGRPIMVWNYVNKYGHTKIPGIPAYTPLAVGKYYESISPWIFGMFMECECDRFLYFAMNYYMLGKVSWNTKTDVEAVMEEYYKLMFGPAAPVMKKMMEDFEHTWIQKIAGRTVDTNLGPVVSVPATTTLWNEIYSPAKIASIEKEFDRAAKMVKAGSLEAKRIELFRREFLVPMQKASQEFTRQTNTLQGLRYQMGKKIHLIPFILKNQKVGKTVETMVTARCTAEDLVITFECEEPLYNEILFKKRNNDDPETWRDNCVEIFLDPEGKHQSYYQLIINHGGAILDYKYKVVGKNAVSDINWNSEAKVQTRKTSNGYSVEVAIPLKNLEKLNRNGFPVNFARDRVLKKTSGHQTDYVSSPFQTNYHDVANFALLTFGDKEIIQEGDFDSISARGPRHWGYYVKNDYIGWAGAGSFELTKGTRAELDKEVFFTAPHSLKLSSDTLSYTVEQDIKYQFKPDTKYRISCMVKLKDVVPVKTGGGFYLNLWDDNNRFFPRTALTGSNDWTYLSFIHKTSATVDKTKKSYFRVWLLYCTGTVWVDNISIEEITE